MKKMMIIGLLVLCGTAQLFCQVSKTDFTGESEAQIVYRGDYGLQGTILVKYRGTEKKIVIPGNLGITEIGDGVFIEYGIKSESDIVSVTIPEGVQRLGQSFVDCYDLAEVYLPASLTNIHDDVFSQCNKLTQISVSEKNTAYTSVDGVLFDKAKTVLIKYPAGKTGRNYAIPAGIRQIKENAFRNSENIISITIPPSTISIESGAFDGCSSLASMNLPQNITSIERCTFNGCSGLTSVTVPPNVTSIGDSAFSGCSSLKSVTIPPSVVSIGWATFEHCGLTSIVIPVGVTSIERYTFNGCSSLSNITIPPGVVSIKGYAFYYCSSLTSVTIPGVTSIDEYAFSNCSNLKSVTIPNISSIGAYSFSRCRSLTSVYIPSGVSSIGVAAFAECRALQNIFIPPSVNFIGSWAFFDCNSLMRITIGANVTLDTSGPDRLFYPSSRRGFGSTGVRVGDNIILPPFGVPFTYAYERNGKAAGTYSRESSTSAWSKE